jgi:prolipoprotein diacylglyceryltransferase
VHDGIPIDHCTGEYCSVLENPVWPTSLYDFILMASLCVILILIRNKIKMPGHLFSILIMVIGVQRFFIEKIRVNNTYDIASFQITQAEIISVIMVILGGIGLWYFRKRYLKSQSRPQP